jgi:hypothetical protein
MHGQRMEAAEKLFPVGVWFAIELDQPWQQRKPNDKRQGHGPRNSHRFASRKKSACKHSS